jgi:uncharacterized protein YvpB
MSSGLTNPSQLSTSDLIKVYQAQERQKKQLYLVAEIQVHGYDVHEFTKYVGYLRAVMRQSEIAQDDTKRINKVDIESKQIAIS